MRPPSKVPESVESQLRTLLGDGYLDILLTGWDGSTPHTLLYRNQGNGTFVDVTSIAFPDGVPGLFRSSVAFGDYDGDGYLDILLTGFDTSLASRTLLYQNQAKRSLPTLNPPSNLNVITTPSALSIAWTSPTQLGYSYNVRVIDASTSSLSNTPMTVDLSSTRLLPAIGNAQTNEFYGLLGNFVIGSNYSISVQTIGADYRSSVWVTTFTNMCGNGMLNAGEECDDGNTTSGDGCSFPGCTVEAGYVCQGEPSYCIRPHKGHGVCIYHFHVLPLTRVIQFWPFVRGHRPEVEKD